MLATATISRIAGRSRPVSRHGRDGWVEGARIGSRTAVARRVLAPVVAHLRRATLTAAAGP